MAHLLHLDASPRGERSHSRKPSKQIVDAWLANHHPDDTVTYRDLGHNPVPLVDETMIAAAFTPPDARSEDARATLKISDELIDELFAADFYLFGVPAGFKACIDQIVRCGRTFTVPDFQGLLEGKQLIVAMSAGKNCAVGAPFANHDYVVPYLKAVFGLVGVTDVSTVNVATNQGEELLAQTRARASDGIAKSVGSAA